MGTYIDVLKKKYANTENEPSDRKSNESSDGKTEGGSSYIDELKSKYAYEDSSAGDINGFLTDANAYFGRANTDYKNIGYANARDTWLTHHRDTSNLLARGLAIQKYLEKNKNAYDPETYKAAIDSITQVNNALSGSDEAFRAVSSSMSQFKTEDEYNTAKNEYEWSQKYQGKSSTDLQNIALGLDDGEEKDFVLGYAAYMDNEEKGSFDLEDGQAEIDAMNEKLAELRRQKNAGVYGGAPYAAGQGSAAAYGMPYAAGQQGGDDIDRQIRELEKQITQKRQYLNTAIRIQNWNALASAPENADFGQYSGYVSTVDTQDGTVDETYEWINNRNGYREQYEADRAERYKTQNTGYGAAGPSSAYTSTGYGAGQQAGIDRPVPDSEYEQKGYDYLTDEEIAIYNYYYAKEGKEKAQQYLDSIQEKLNQRKAKDMFAAMEGNTAAEIVFGIASGAENFAYGVKNLFNFDGEYVPISAFQYAGGMARDDLEDTGPVLPEWMGGGSLGQLAYDVANTSANMAPSLLAATAANIIVPGSGAWIGSVLMGMSAGGNAYQQAINEGFDKDEARMYGFMVGASEAIMDKFIGGIGKFGGNKLGKFFIRNMNATDNAFKMIVKNVLGGMASEFTEEYIQEIIEPVLQNLILDTDHEVEIFSTEAMYAGILGALTAFGTESIDAGVTAARYTGTGRDLIGAGVKADDLAAVGSKFAADTVAYKLAGQIDENTDAFTMGRMFHEISANLTEQNVSAIAEALEQEGMPPKIARKNAEIMAYIVDGGKVSDFQMKMIEKNNVLAKVMREVIIDPNSTVYQRSVGYSDVMRKLAGETVDARSTGSGKAKVSTEDTTATQKESGSESRSEGGAGDRKASGIVSVKKGNPVVKLDDGSEVSLQDADLSPDDALIIKTVTDIDGISAQDAGDIFKILKAVDSDPAASSLGAMEAYRYGYYGFSEKHLADNAYFAKKLTETQRKAIYDIGQKARQQSLGKSKPKQKSTKGEKTGVYFDQGGGKVVSFSESEKSGLSPQQNAGVRDAMVLRKLGIGGDIYFFESYLNSEGKRVFKNENGEEVSAPNGWYDPKDGSIHIDLNAGNKGQGYVLFTLSHELTHFIEQWSEEKYKVLADFLVKNYEKGHTMDELVRRKQRRLTEIRGKEVSYSEAYSEVVADSMEAMLADGNVMAKLIELKAKAQSLFEKMKQFFDNLLNKIRDAYKGLQPDSEEGKAVLEMQESIEKIQQLFAEALVEASENYRNAETQKNTDQEVGVQYSHEQNMSMRGVYDVYEKPITEKDIEVLRSIERKSVNKFTSDDLEKSQKWAHRFFKEIGTKSPFFRAWFGDWRMYDASDVVISDIPQYIGTNESRKKNRGVINNIDTKWNIRISREGETNTISHSGADRLSEYGLAGIQNLVKNAVLLNTEVHEHHKNNPINDLITFDHKLYALGRNTDGEIGLYRITVEEYYQSKKEPANKKFHNLKYIEKIADITGGRTFGKNRSGGSTDGNSAITYTVSDVAYFVKKYDDEYSAPPVVSETVLNENGTPKVVYHGSAEKFTVFSYGHIGSQTGVGILGDGFYFTDKKRLAKNYGGEVYPVYLKMKNPYIATESDVYTLRTTDLESQGYDGVILRAPNGDVYMVFNNTHIKSATDNIGTFDGNNPDIRYSDRDTESVSNRSLLANALESAVKNDIERKRLVEYKAKIETINAEEQRLREVRAQIKELSFAKGTRDTKKLKDLKSEAAKISNHLSVYEGQLQRMEKELQSVVKRERAKVVKEAEKRDKAVLAKEWMAAEVKQSETLREYRETRAALRQQESDTAVMEKEFIRIAKEYEKQDAERVKTISDLRKELKNEAKKHRADERMWMAEFGRLMREYEAADRDIGRLERKIKRQKDTAEKSAMRRKISKVVKELDKVLNKGNKKRNVKEDMKGFVSKALQLADYLFTDHISNDDLIRKGITVRMTSEEAALVKETESILFQLYDNADNITDAEFKMLDNKRKRNIEKLHDLLDGQRNEFLSTPVYNLFNDLVTEYASFKNSKQDAVKNAYNPEVERFLRSYIGDSADGTDSDRKTVLQNMRVKDMNMDELWRLYNAYTMVLHSIRNANKLFVKGRTVSIDKMVEAIAWDFGSRKIPDKKMSVIARNLINKIGWDYEKLYYALDRIGSDSFTELVMNVANSENIVMQDVMEADAFRDEMVEKYGFNNWDVNKEIDRVFLDNTGKKFKLTLGQLMALYAYSRREGAWDHIEYGGFVFGEAALTNPKPADSYKLNQEQCKAITSLLTEEQKNYVKDMQKFLSETMGEKGNEVSMLLYGIKMFGEKNYFPIHIAGQFKAQANESQAKAAAGFQSMSNAGFTHAQNPNAKAPFVLEGFNEVWVDHVNEMSRYHGTVPALEDMRRVMNRSSYSETTAESMAIKQLMENSFGKEAVDYFDNLYREANSGAITDKMQKHSQKLLSMFRKNSVVYSLSVLVQQSASIVRAYALIHPKYFAGKGFGTITSGVVKAVSDKWTKAHTNAYNEMLKYAPGVTMAKEIGGFDTATGGSIRSYLLDTNKSFKQKWKTGTTLEKGKAVLDVVDNNVIANLPNVADKIAWIEIWNACKREAIHKHHNLKPSSDEFLKLVGERFTEVIRATQVYDSIFAKSPMLKSKSLAVQYLVSFMNEPNTTANMAESALRDFARGDKKTGFRKAVVLVHSIIFTGVLKSIIYAMRDDDEDETYIEKYIEAIVGSLMDDFNPLNYIPLVRDVWSLAQGYDVERADMAIVADAIDSLSAVIKNTLKDTEHMTEKELIEFDKKCTEDSWKLAESLAAFFGIPMKNIRREIDAVVDHARIAKANMGKTTKAGIKYAIEEAWTGKSVPDKVQLYEARMAGDTEHAARVEARYDDAESANAAVRAAIKDSFMAGEIDESTALKHMVLYAGMDADEAYWLMDSWKYRKAVGSDDGYGKYSNLYDAVRTGTDLEGVIKTYTDNGIKPSTLTSQITEEFKPEYVKLTPKERSAMRGKLVDAFVLCGMEREDAEEKLDSWDFEAEHGFAYSDRKEAYENGEVSRSELVAILVGRGYSPEDANAQIDSYEWEAEGYEDVTYAAIRNYNAYCAPVGISKAVYVSFWEFEKDTENDVNEATGKPIAYSAVRKIMAYINSLNLTPAQKDALAKSAGWKDSTIKKYKLW